MKRVLQRVRSILVFTGIVFVLLEGMVRVVFPLPEVVGFDRLAYAGSLAEHLEEPPMAIGHLELWWWSEPDGASFMRRTNLYGFCDDEWTLEKSRASRRVVFVGDSFVEGLGAPEGETLTARFHEKAEEAGLAVEALNWGAAGFGLANYARLIADAAPFFLPDDLVLVLYANDFYHVPEAGGLVRASGTLRHGNPWRLRLADLLRGGRGRRTVKRWHESVGPPGGPKPIDVAPRFAADPELLRHVELFVAPEIASAMKNGRLNPAMTNLLDRSVRVLPTPIDVGPYLSELAAYLDTTGTRLWVAYLPSMNQVSDAYLPAQRRISAPIEETTLTGDRFQQHARDLLATCEALGLPCLDLTPALRTAESGGERLYWPYDGHMNSAGYRAVGDELWHWWEGGS